jgi:hypothetical protein
MIIVIIFIIIGLMVFFIVLERQQQKQRTEAMQQLALEMGAQFQEADPLLLDRLSSSGLDLFRRGHSRRMRNVLRRSQPGGEISVFDYVYVTGSGKHRHTHHQTAALLDFEQSNLPEFILRPQGFFDDLAAKFGKSDINIESNPEFSRRYHLSSPDETATRQLFNGSLLDFCERQERLVIESNGKQILFYRQFSIKPENLREFVDEARQVAGYFRLG